MSIANKRHLDLPQMRTHLDFLSSKPSSPLESITDIICKCTFLSPVLFNPLQLDFHAHHSTEITIINSLRPRHRQTQCHLSCHLTSLLSKIQKGIFPLEVCSLPSPMEDPLILWAILSSTFSEPVLSSILETLAYLRVPSWDLLCSFLSLLFYFLYNFILFSYFRYMPAI